jgi:predicted nucleic acid-binding protein
LKKHALLNQVESVTSEEKRLELRRVLNKQHLAATLQPIWRVGVQKEVSRLDWNRFFSE